MIKVVYLGTRQPSQHGTLVEEFNTHQVTTLIGEDMEGMCKLQSSLDLFSYCDVRVQSNPYVLKETGVY